VYVAARNLQKQVLWFYEPTTLELLATELFASGICRLKSSIHLIAACRVACGNGTDKKRKGRNVSERLRWTARADKVKPEHTTRVHAYLNFQVPFLGHRLSAPSQRMTKTGPIAPDGEQWLRPTSPR